MVERAEASASVPRYLSEPNSCSVSIRMKLQPLRQKQLLCRKLNRSKLLSFFATVPQCVVGMETCASANYCDGTRSRGAPDADTICEAVCQGLEERCV